MPKVEKLPVCVGLYEKTETACIGNSVEQGEEAQPCAWNVLCSAFSKYLSDDGCKREQFVQTLGSGQECFCMAIQGNEEFVEFCQSLANDQFKEQRKKKKKKKAYRRKPGPKRKTRRKGPKTLERANRAKEMLVHFFNCVKSTFPDRMIHGACPKIGQLYVRNHTQSCGYFALYCWSIGGDLPVLMFRPRKSLDRADILLPIGMATFEEHAPKALCNQFPMIDAVEGSKFRTRLREVDRAAMAELIEHLKHLVDRGIFKWPTVKSGLITRTNP